MRSSTTSGFARRFDGLSSRSTSRTLPEGLETRVGERGARLSGGQRQRLGIARALYRQPAVLVLDEATSSLDNETERRVTDVIRALHGDVTVIVVAHRLSTVMNCDQIVFLEAGRIAATGSFEEVRRQSEAFDHLVELGTLDGSWQPAERHEATGYRPVQ